MQCLHDSRSRLGGPGSEAGTTGIISRDDGSGMGAPSLARFGSEALHQSNSRHGGRSHRYVMESSIAFRNRQPRLPALPGIPLYMSAIARSHTPAWKCIPVVRLVQEGFSRRTVGTSEYAGDLISFVIPGGAKWRPWISVQCFGDSRSHLGGPGSEAGTTGMLWERRLWRELVSVYSYYQIRGTRFTEMQERLLSSKNAIPDFLR